MSVTGMDWYTFSGAGNGIQTIQVNIAPASVFAQLALYGCFGSGINYTGIKHYRRRLSSGADQDIDFGGWTTWPPAIWDNISSITFGTATGDGQQAWALARMDFWG